MTVRWLHWSVRSRRELRTWRRRMPVWVGLFTGPYKPVSGAYVRLWRWSWGVCAVPRDTRRLA